MKIAIEVSALTTGHKFRGVGFYLENLKKALLSYYPKNQYMFFSRRYGVPRQADVVHYPFFDPFFVSLPLYKKKKSIVTVHDLTPIVFAKDFPAGIKGDMRWQVQKKLLQKMDAVITDSSSSKKDVVKLAGVNEKKITVVPLSASEDFKRVENRKLLEKVKKKYNLPSGFVLYVGDVTVNKNVPSLIRAVKKAKLPLVMVGKVFKNVNFDKYHPWNKDLVLSLELAAGDKNIYCPGFVPAEDLSAIYSLARVFAMPSLYEGFGLPVLEAMACGCPVVSSDKGSLKEVGGNAVLYMDPYSEEDMAKKIKKVFNDKALQKELSEKGFLRASSFSWKKTAAKTIKVYEEVLNSYDGK